MNYPTLFSAKDWLSLLLASYITLAVKTYLLNYKEMKLKICIFYKQTHLFIVKNYYMIIIFINRSRKFLKRRGPHSVKVLQSTKRQISIDTLNLSEAYNKNGHQQKILIVRKNGGNHFFQEKTYRIKSLLGKQ